MQHFAVVLRCALCVACSSSEFIVVPGDAECLLVFGWEMESQVKAAFLLLQNPVQQG